MGLQSKLYYFWLKNANGKFLYATYDTMGNPVIKTQSQPIPLQFSPADLVKSKLSFATNQKYFSLNRSISYPLKFIKDGADILRYIDYLLQGYESDCYLIVTKLNTLTGINELAYNGKIDFSKKIDDPRTDYTVSTLDESAWSLLSANENITYSIDCSPTNPKAIKVLFHGVTLNNRVTYQPVAAMFNIIPNEARIVALPMVIAAQDGDSAGVIFNSQQLFNYGSDITTVQDSPNWAINSLYGGSVAIKGVYSFLYNFQNIPALAKAYLYTSLGNLFILGVTSIGTANNETINISIDNTIVLSAGEKVFLLFDFLLFGYADGHITPIISNIVVATITASRPQLYYGLRAFDLLQAIVNKATAGRYNIRSDYFENANILDACFSGDAIRQSPNAYIQSSFADWFKSFDARYYLSLRIINGQLWIEPTKDIYQQGSILMDLGEISNLTLAPTTEYICNEIKVGSPKQDYRHSNGRYEFNSTNSFSTGVKTVQKTLDLVSKYRFDCYGIVFLILDYQGSSSKDNSGDTNVFVARITNNKISAQTPVETFVNVTTDNAPTAPFIRYPANNAWINNDKPTVRGKATPSTTVYVYVDHSLDGSTTSDANGDWVYTITTSLQSLDYTVNPDGSITVIHTGVHVIDATFTDDAGILNTINVTVDTTTTAATKLTSPDGSVTLYNNKPLLKGVAPTGTTITVKVDGATIGSTTADGSCLWFYQLGVLTDGNRTININGIDTILTIMPRGEITSPLITSFADGFTEVNNLPTIEGVSQPNTTVTVYLNYLQPTILGSTLSDSNGNWSITVVPQPYPINPPIPYIPNGLNVISTELVNAIVYISTSGYQLERPNFSEIDGVIDNTIFNTWYSPHRMLEARMPLWKSIFYQLTAAQLTFEAADKNALLKTVLNGVTVQENAPIRLSNYTDLPIFLPIKAKFTTRVQDTFNQILYNFNSGGNIKGEYNGNTIYFTPVGSMTQASVTDEAQQWELLLSPMNLLSDIAKLSMNKLTLDTMNNAISISDYSTLQWVMYDFTKDPKYNTYQYYQEWFKNRNTRYITQPDYYQKWQTNEPLTTQIVNANLSDMNLKVYDCITAKLLGTIAFSAPTTQPVASPKVVLEAVIDFTAYGEGEYFCTICSGAQALAISEKIQVRDVFDETILFECSDNKNNQNTFYSTGFISSFRVEGLVTNFKPEINTFQNKDEVGNNQMLHSVPSKKVTIYFGDAAGLPDWAAIKVGLFTQLSTCMIEGIQYVMVADSKLEANDTDGFPMFYYKLDMELAKNSSNTVFLGTAGNNITTIAVDASAFGGTPNTIIDVELTND